MKQLNVLVIETDQQRYDCLGSSGNPFIRTPHLDTLAAEGTVFTRHISANPVCQPSRCSLHTGLYTPAHGVYTNGIALNRREYVNSHDITIEEPLTLADRVAAAGYDTAAFGKLHLTPNIENDAREHQCPTYPESYAVMAAPAFRDWHGPYYGFRHVEFTGGHGEIPVTTGHYAQWLHDTAPDVYAEVLPHANPYFSGGAENRLKLPVAGQQDLYPSKIPGALHNTTWLAERFIEYLQRGRRSDRPFFAYVGFPDPHHPFTPSFDIAAQFEGIPVKPPVDPTGEQIQGSILLETVKRPPRVWSEEVLRYTYAMLYQVDLAAGQMMEALRQAGLWEDTLVVFTSDHGDFLGDHGLLYKSEVGSEALLHVPYIMRVPGRSLPSQVDIPMSNVDVLPTLLACAGVGSACDTHGEDITAHLTDDSRRVYAHCNNNTGPRQINYTLYDHEHRYTWYPFAERDELFDYRADPGEIRNLASNPAHAALIADYRRQLADSLVRHYNPIMGRIGIF